MCNTSLQGWKGNVIKRQKLEYGIWKTIKIRYIYSLRFYALAGTERYKRGFVKKKTKAIKVKIQENFSLLMFSTEFNLERELCNTSVLSSHTWIKSWNSIIRRQIREEIKRNGYMLHKKTSYRKNKAEAYYRSAYVNRVQYGLKSYFILTFLLEICQVQYLQS